MSFSFTVICSYILRDYRSFRTSFLILGLPQFLLTHHYHIIALTGWCICRFLSLRISLLPTDHTYKKILTARFSDKFWNKLCRAIVISAYLFRFYVIAFGFYKTGAETSVSDVKAYCSVESNQKRYIGQHKLLKSFSGTIIVWYNNSNSTLQMIIAR